MAGLSDSVTVGILLLLIFGAAAFYLYSRMTQNEKRLSLLESLLLTLKISTEASLHGPDTVEPMSNASPLESHEVDAVNEEDYANMLKSVSPDSLMTSEPPPLPPRRSQVNPEEDIRPMDVPKTEMNVNYESMTVKELQAVAKERGLPSMTRKKELVDALKKGGPPPAAPMPLVPAADELEGSEKIEGFTVNLDD